jgi:sulfoacetaldehyde acetyltransferase
VEAPDQIGDALRDATRSDACGVAEIMLTQELGEPFRRDALGEPERFLDKYKPYAVV